jgi:hypothetical protein
MDEKYKMEYSKAPSGMCEPGYHTVRGHWRECASGVTTWVDEHTRKNLGQNTNFYLSENLYYLFHQGTRKYPSIGKICGFPEYKSVDDLIQFWLDYWKSKGLPFPDDLNPKLIKALIAHESSFNPNARSKSSTALGLMQLTKKTMNALSGKKGGISKQREVKKENLKLDHESLKDPMLNVAAGTRWLSHKFSIIGKEKEKTSFNMLKAYNQWNEKGEEYARKVYVLYNAKCK